MNYDYDALKHLYCLYDIGFELRPGPSWTKTLNLNASSLCCLTKKGLYGIGRSFWLKRSIYLFTLLYSLSFILFERHKLVSKFIRQGFRVWLAENIKKMWQNILYFCLIWPLLKIPINVGEANFVFWWINDHSSAALHNFR